MKIAFLTNILSPHQLPLAKAIVRLVGENNYRYIYTEHFHHERRNMGWEQNQTAWCLHSDSSDPNIASSEILISELRELEIFRKQLYKGKKVIYVSERWFKPPLGMFRLLVPAYLYMALRFILLLKKANFFYFPQGIHAARDIMRLYLLFHGHLSCLFCPPKVAFESRPGGCIVPLQQAINTDLLSIEEISFAKKNGFVQIPRHKWDKVHPCGIWGKLKIWGYFVAPSQKESSFHTPKQSVMWAGRMLSWKRVTTLVKVCCRLPQIHLDLYGHGETESALRNIAMNSSNISFHDFVPISQIRTIMSQHDIYVLPSDAREGWGAVVSEALEEKMQVFASIESGAGATILPSQNLFNAKDARKLERLLLNMDIPHPEIGLWTAEYAADYLINCINNQ